MLTNKIYPINLATWHSLGVQYLLATSSLKKEFCIEHFICEPKKDTLAKAKQSPVSSRNFDKDNKHNLARKTYAESRVQGNRVQENIQRNAPSKNNVVHNAENNTVSESDNAFNQSSPIEKLASNLESKTLPLHEWPKEWKELLSNKNFAKVIWTYTGLGDDISGQGVPERKDLIRRLIKELAFPTGTHAFWPLSLPRHEDNELNTQIFWSAAQRLEARAIVIMGSTALKAFNLPRNLCPLQQTVYNGYMLIVLPDINFLIDEMQKYTPMREFIRTALKKYVQG